MHDYNLDRDFAWEEANAKAIEDSEKKEAKARKKKAKKLHKIIFEKKECTTIMYANKKQLKKILKILEKENHFD
jgi:hypothetical protein